MNRQQTIFIIIADIILLAVIAFLFGLVLNKNLDFRDRIICKLKGTTISVKQNPSSTDTEISTSGFFAREDTKFLLKNDIKPGFNAAIQIVGKYFLLNTSSGSVYQFQFKNNVLTARADNSLVDVTALKPFGKNFLYMEPSGKFYLISSKSLLIQPFFFYSSGAKMIDFPATADIDKNGTLDLLFPDSFSHVVCLDGKTFAPKWTFQDASDQILHSPVILNVNNDGVPDAVFASKDGVLYAADGKSGWIIWKNPIQQPISSPLFIEDINNDGNKEIIFTSDTGTLFCLTHLGTLLWQLTLEEKAEQTILFSDLNRDGSKDIIITLINGKILAFNGISKMKLWDYQAQQPIVPGTTTVYDADNDGKPDIIFSDRTPSLYVLQGTTGREIAKLPLEEEPVTELKCVKDACYYVSRNNNLHTIRFMVQK